jgi:hypothetical protein
MGRAAPARERAQTRARHPRLAPVRLRSTMLASEATSGNTQMAFLTLRDGVAADDEERAKLAGRWAALLGTNAVKISYHMIGGNELLITEEQGRIIEVKDFVLQQPEVLKFRWCARAPPRAAPTRRAALLPRRNTLSAPRPAPPRPARRAGRTPTLRPRPHPRPRPRRRRARRRQRMSSEGSRGRRPRLNLLCFRSVQEGLLRGARCLELAAGAGIAAARAPTPLAWCAAPSKFQKRRRGFSAQVTTSDVRAYRRRFAGAGLAPLLSYTRSFSVRTTYRIFALT